MREEEKERSKKQEEGRKTEAERSKRKEGRRKKQEERRKKKEVKKKKPETGNKQAGNTNEGSRMLSYRCTGRLMAASQNDPPNICSFKLAYSAEFPSFVFDPRANPPHVFGFGAISSCAPRPPPTPKNPSPETTGTRQK